MTKKVLIISTILLLLTTLNSCRLMEYDLTEAFYRLMNVEKRTAEFKVLEDETNLNLIADDEEYDVLIITDIHIGNENHGKNGPRREADWFKQLNEIDSETGKAILDEVKFAICLGDVADHGLLGEFNRFNSLVTEKLQETKTSKAPEGIKIYSVVGNHDLYNSGWNYWSQTQYPGTSFYKFETPSFSWYFIDSASGTIGDQQFDILQKNLKNDPKPKLLFSHIPLYADNFQYFIMQDTEERNAIINTVSKNNSRMFIDGHTHEELYTDFGKFQEINVPGFLEKYGYGILHVNEKEKTLSMKIKYY